MSIEKINSNAIPHFNHILSHATKVPGLIFVSGQVPIDQDAVIIPGGIQEHTIQCIKNIGAVLEAAGSSWEKVVKVNVYLKNMDDFHEMNDIYEKLIPTPKPSRTCIQAGKLPNDVDVEMEKDCRVTRLGQRGNFEGGFGPMSCGDDSDVRRDCLFWQLETPGDIKFEV